MPTVESASLKRKRWNGAPVACVVLGGWLLIWGLLLPHGSSIRTLTLLFGALIAAASSVSIAVPIVSWLTMLLAAALLIASVIGQQGMAHILWHNVLISAVVLVLSALSNRSESGAVR
jgi:hypothetical protein